MPINLLSVGLASQMLPLSAAWLNEHGATLVLQRLSLFAAVLAAAALVYFGVLWQFRDWIFAVVLKKQMAQRDQLIALWFAAVLVMVVRDQMIHLLVIRTRFKLLTLLTLASAILSLTASYWGMRAFGQAGAPLGVVIGEVTSLIGIVMLSLRETDRVVTAPSPAATGEAMAQHLAPFN
jgi:O-antigen/teichoic acid export membrane protein